MLTRNFLDIMGDSSTAITGILHRQNAHVDNHFTGSMLLRVTAQLRVAKMEAPSPVRKHYRRKQRIHSLITYERDLQSDILLYLSHSLMNSLDN